jgi:hypothetical protein
MQADSYDTLSLLASKGANIPPQVLIELSPLQDSVKKRILGYFNQPNPMQQIQQAGAAAEVDKTKSETMLNIAKARSEGIPDMPQGEQGDGIDPRLKNMKAAAEIESEQASARHKNAQAAKTTIDAMLAPHQVAHDVVMDRANLEQSAMDKAEDRRLAARQTKETA